LSLVSRVFLREHRSIIEQLRATDHAALLSYVLQQIHQFRTLGEDFAMQHTDSELLGQVEEELQAARFFLGTMNVGSLQTKWGFARVERCEMPS